MRDFNTPKSTRFIKTIIYTDNKKDFINFFINIMTLLYFFVLIKFNILYCFEKFLGKKFIFICNIF